VHYRFLGCGALPSQMKQSMTTNLKQGLKVISLKKNAMNINFFKETAKMVKNSTKIIF
jgi:hypothetical protein